MKYSFFSHPNNVCMSYFQHMKLSLSFSFHMFTGSCKAIVHAFIPSLFITGTTDTAIYLEKTLKNSGCRDGHH